MKVVEEELRLARKELQAVKGDLCAKVTTLDRVRQEALEAGNLVERLTEELGKLWMDLERQKALASRRGEPNGLLGGLPFSAGLPELS